ncbi:MAG: tetratricopeptide repeat protein, partial [Anaerolineales bacterium]|nr:tetratricopeptide repeat protein [Anaerolineales bacterium]
MGTGFFVSGGLILTCAHVIAEYYKPGRQIDCQLEGQISHFKADVIYFSPKGEYDLAILQPIEEIEHIPLPFSTSQSSKGNPFSIFGYPQIEFRGLNGAGTIMGWTTTPQGYKILQLDSKHITHGFSGAPVLDEKLGVVVGVLQQGIKNDEIGRPSFALPIEVIKEVYPDLQVGIPTAPGGLPPGSYIPFPRNALFTGREAELAELEKGLCSPFPVGAPFGDDKGTGVRSIVISQAITGMGGIGKTQLAVEFAYRYGHAFKGVHWLDLRDPETLDASIALCGTHMGLAYDKQPEQVAYTLKTWQTDGPRLLILDNFEDVTKTGNVLSRFHHPSLRLLITSRRKDFPKSAGLQTQELDIFNETESLEFLGRTLDREASKKDRKALAEKLGYLPLALELAANYINITEFEISHYMQELEDILAHESMQEEWFKELEITNPTDHELSLLATFQLSWQELKDENQQRIFKIIGYCATNVPIPLDIFKQVLDLDNKEVKSDLYRISAIGLVRLAEDKPLVHPIISEFARFKDKNKLMLEPLLSSLVLLLNSINGEIDTTGNASLLDVYYLHAVEIAEHAKKTKLDSLSDLYYELAYFGDTVATYNDVEKWVRKALELDKHNYGVEHAKTLHDLNALGGVLTDLGKYDEAKETLEKVLNLRKDLFGENHIDVATTSSNLGIVLRDQGDYEGAKVAFKRALQIDEAAFGSNHPNVARDVNNLGEVLRSQGVYEGAKAAFERAIRILETSLDENHPHVARVINNLGGVALAQGDYDGAKIAFERAIRILEINLGEDHPDIAMGINNLGQVLQAQGDYKGAKVNFERAIKIWEANLGEDHPDIAMGINNLGQVLQAQGDYEGAKVNFERAIKIWEVNLGEDHPNI